LHFGEPQIPVCTTASLFPVRSVNQIRLLGAKRMPQGLLDPIGTVSDVVNCNVRGSNRPIRFVADSVNQSLPSGPVVMSQGKLDEPGIGNRVMVPDGVTRPI
jgi:hypothetical protein